MGVTLLICLFQNYTQNEQELEYKSEFHFWYDSFKIKQYTHHFRPDDSLSETKQTDQKLLKTKKKYFMNPYTESNFTEQFSTISSPQQKKVWQC